MLDEAGLTDTRIVASSDLDEHTLLNLKSQGAQVDAWGVGTRLITAYDQPALGAVYKLVARDQNGEWLPSIKISSNPEKVTTPGLKSVYRIIDRRTHKARADLITPAGQQVDEGKTLTLFHPVHTYRKKKVRHFRAVPLLEPIFEKGKRVYELPTLEEIKAHYQKQRTLFWEEYLRLLNPEEFPVDLTDELWETKQNLIRKIYQQIRTENGNGNGKS